jgi:PTS system mannose-specific IIA component
VRGVLVTHGNLGAELLRTAEAIVGPQPGIVVISNAGLSARDLAERVATEVAGAGAVVLFVDLGGGSCGHICAVARRDHPHVLVARGVNLPMLLEFLHHRDRVPLGELKVRLWKKGREGIECVGWEAADAE